MEDGWEGSPPTTRVKRSKEEARAAYDRMSAWYDLVAGPSERKFIEAGLRRLDVRRGERVLEVGPGTGHALASLGAAVGGDGRVYGVDISEKMGQLAMRRLDEAELLGRAALIRGDGARLPLRDGGVDAVFMSFTLELFDTPRIPRVLDECARVLGKSGRVCVVGMAQRGRRSLAVRAYEWVHNRLPQYVDCRPIPMEGVLEQAGFEIGEVEKGSMWGLPIDIVLCQAPELSG